MATVMTHRVLAMARVSDHRRVALLLVRRRGAVGQDGEPGDERKAGGNDEPAQRP
jgi:hypothetical protein